MNTDSQTRSEETEVSISVSPDVVYQQDKATIDMQITTAKAYPRNPRRATENALAIVTISPKVAETCTYAVPRGGKRISGPSVHLARVLAQNWGNLRIEAKVVDIDRTHVTSEGVCFDLENNIAIKTQVKRSIIGKTGRFSEDMITVTGNAANAIALRNAILMIIPKGIVDTVYAAAKDTITGDVSDKNKLIAKRKSVFDGLKDAYEVTEKDILSAIGKASIDFVSADDLVVLVGIGQAIRDGDTTVEQAFKGEKVGTEPVITLEELKKLYDEKLHLINNSEMKDFKRIIENNEVNSFKKVHTILMSKKDEQNQQS